MIVTIHDVWLINEFLKERNGCIHTLDHKLIQGPTESHQAFVAVATMNDQLADQTVIIGRDPV